jgi:hypothetical protein
MKVCSVCVAGCRPSWRHEREGVSILRDSRVIVVVDDNILLPFMVLRQAVAAHSAGDTSPASALRDGSFAAKASLR